MVGGQDRRGRRPRGSRRSRRRRSLRARRGRASRSGGPTAIWRRLRQRTESQRARLLEVVGGDRRSPAPPPASVGDQRFEQLGAGPVEAGERLVEQQHAGVLDERAGDQRRAGAGRRRARRRSPPRAARGRPARAPRAAASRSRAARAPPPGQARERAHRRHVERRDRVVEARALGLRHRRAARADAQLPASGRSSPSSARSSVVLPPPLGPSSASLSPAAQREVDARRSPAAPP